MSYKWELGAKVKDKVTGYAGIVVCQSRWLCKTGGPQPEPQRHRDVRR